MMRNGIRPVARRSPALAVALAGVLVACTSASPAGAPVSSSPTSSSTAQAPSHSAAHPTPAATYPANIVDRGDEEPLEAGTYFVEPEGIPVRVLYTIPSGSKGWRSWIGSFKPETGRPYHWVGMSIINVTNLVTDACTNHTAQNPVVGPTVENLAKALTRLKPFKVETPPADVTVSGYSGKHLALTVPAMETTVLDGAIAFADCTDRQLKSWIGAPLSYGFWGYTGSGTTEEFWVLNVGERRLVIEANYLPDSPAQDIAELHAILDSIHIVPIPS